MKYTIRYLAKNEDGTHSVWQENNALSVQCYADGSEVFNSEVSELRPELIRFAVAMEHKLKLNDYKGGWKGRDGRAHWVMSSEEILARAEAELKELKDCAEDADILGEVADVMNYLMMLCDVKGLLTPDSA